ncbi:unnamed protein product [Brachionus calyciflorus]|uniref:Reverse transcriptase domain-containing protein n=1 Tax=Brachionus calyciflorus TaxID=104777 RepID=A0A814AJA8_9BILA|nr:unnamed protein product [Brachionus calyciflorus]
MLENNLIQHSSSPWCSSLQLVAKPDRSKRITVDYRLLNNVTVKDAYPLPHTDCLLSKLGGAKYFSKLVLHSGYYQIMMNPEHQKYTAFGCEFGLFEYRVMPMGLTNACATFQRIMNGVLKRCIVYLDDIIIYSPTLNDHVLHVLEVIDILKINLLKEKLKKCELLKLK